MITFVKHMPATSANVLEHCQGLKMTKIQELEPTLAVSDRLRRYSAQEVPIQQEPIVLNYIKCILCLGL
jgi:hypothetical protein